MQSKVNVLNQASQFDHEGLSSLLRTYQPIPNQEEKLW